MGISGFLVTLRFTKNFEKMRKNMLISLLFRGISKLLSTLTLSIFSIDILSIDLILSNLFYIQSS